MNWWTAISTELQPRFVVAGVTLHYYGIIIGLALLASLILATRRSRHYHFTREDVETAFVWAIVPALIGARIYHVLDNWAYYLLRPFDVLAVWQGGLGIYGAIVGGVAGLAYAAQNRKVKLLPLMDLFAPSVALGQAIGRWGNFFNQEGYGPPTELPWKIYITAARRVPEYADSDFFHPLFLYESLWNLAVMGLLLYIARKKTQPGVVAASYLVLYGLGRFVTEFGRLDTATLAGVKVAQLVSVIFIISGLIFILRRHFHRPLVESSSK